MLPKLSVIMPVFNGEDTVRESIESILNQTFKEFEFIIIDDGSTDKTWKILEEYQLIDRRIKLIKNEKNLGIVESLNKGLNIVSTNIIARMDCGDISLETRLEKQYNFLIKNPEFILVSSQVLFLRGKEAISKSSFPLGDVDIKKELFLKNNVIMHPAVMFRQIGGLNYRKFAYPAEDYDLWLRMAHFGKFAVMNEYLLIVRLNPEGISFSKRIHQMKKGDELHQLLIERLKYDKEISVPTVHFEEYQNWYNKYFGYLFRKLTSQVITQRRKSSRWFFYVIFVHILYPKMLYQKIRYHIEKRVLINRNFLFKKFLKHEDICNQ